MGGSRKGKALTVKRVQVGKIGLTGLPKPLLQLVEPGYLEDSSEQKSNQDAPSRLKNAISVPKLWNTAEAFYVLNQTEAMYL